MIEPIKPTTVPSVHDIVHTPGPWEVFQWAEHMPLAGHPSTVGQSDELGMEAQDVCDIVPTDSKATEWANARLIAAAPEMWAVIQGALRIADLWRPGEDTPEEHWEEAKAVYMMLSKFEEIARKVV